MDYTVQHIILTEFQKYEKQAIYTLMYREIEKHYTITELLCQTLI